MYPRQCKPLMTRSFFLFGPRGVGKTTFLRQLFQETLESSADPSGRVLWIDLLEADEALVFSRAPQELQRRIDALATPAWVVVDEVQKVPALLDEVHRLTEAPQYKGRVKFALTGSSARKLKRGRANLLAGRAFVNSLHPLTESELGKSFSLDEVLHWGSLPSIFSFQTHLERKEYLRTYTSTYLKEEIKEEQLVRKIDPFLRFLEVAAQTNGEILNFSKVARDSGTDPKAVERYFEILSDTLLGFFLDPFHGSIRKRQSQKAKFYLFDTGVKRALEFALDSPIPPGSSLYGRAFEHFIVLECKRLNDYHRMDFRFSYLRTKDDLEVDLIVERPGKKTALVEIKSSQNVDLTDLRKLSKIAGDFKNAEAFVFCRESYPRRVEDVSVLPWELGISRLFGI